jgi:hypothetical protein
MYLLPTMHIQNIFYSPYFFLTDGGEKIPELDFYKGAKLHH